MKGWGRQKQQTGACLRTPVGYLGGMFVIHRYGRGGGVSARLFAAGVGVCIAAVVTGCGGGRGDDLTHSRYVDAELPSGALGLYTEGVLARKAGDRERAESLLRRATQENDRLIMANLVLGEIYAQEQNWENAASFFRRLVERDPETADSHFRLAFSLEQLNRYSEAIRGYLAGLSFERESFDGNLGAGRSYLALDEAQAAKAHLDIATQARPESDEAWLNLALAHDRTNAYREAEAAYRRAIESAGEQRPELLEGLAMMLVYQQDPARIGEAVDLLERVVEEAPSNRSRERLGLAYAIAGRFEEAQEQFSRVLAEDPRNVSALNSRGTAYFLQYRSEGSLDDSLRQQALGAWALSLEVDPDQPDVQQTYDDVRAEGFLQ